MNNQRNENSDDRELVPNTSIDTELEEAIALSL